MGWRFRKTVRFSRWLRVNVSGSGVSLGIGPPGANINISRRGVRQTVGLPGTGISHQSFTKWASPPPSSSPSPSPPTSVLSSSSLSPAAAPPAATSNVVRNLAIAGGLVLLAGWLIWPRSWTPSSAAGPMGAGPPPAATASAEPVRPVMPPPAPNRALTPEEVKEVQILLKALGFDPGGADGIVGPNTIAAVKRYEPSRGWPASGEIDIRLLESLRASKSAPPPPVVAATPPPSSPPSSPTRAPSPSSAPVTVVPSEEMRLASRVIREADHPCPVVAAAVLLSDGSVRAVCSNGEVYRVMQLRGQWLALKCSAAERTGIKGC